MTGIDGVSPLFARALAKQGYTALTEVQRAVLAPDIGEADLLVSAQTGSGKTVAFGLAMASTLLGGEDRFSASSDPLARLRRFDRHLAVERGFLSEKALINQRQHLQKRLRCRPTPLSVE